MSARPSSVSAWGPGQGHARPPVSVSSPVKRTLVSDLSLRARVCEALACGHCPVPPHAAFLGPWVSPLTPYLRPPRPPVRQGWLRGRMWHTCSRSFPELGFSLSRKHPPACILTRVPRSGTCSLQVLGEERTMAAPRGILGPLCGSPRPLGTGRSLRDVCPASQDKRSACSEQPSSWTRGPPPALTLTSPLVPMASAL